MFASIAPSHWGGGFGPSRDRASWHNLHGATRESQREPSGWRATMHFNLITTLDDPPHLFRCYTPADDGWLDELAAEYVALRTSCSFDLDDVRLDGVEILNAAALQARLEANTVPVSTGGGNFDVVRSDMGELLHYLLLETEFQTRFGYKSVRDRELIQLTGRGIDAVGIELDDAKLILCLGETKVSDAAASPPEVVDKKDDCLRAQHLDHLNDLAATTRKVFDLGRRARDPDLQNLFFAAGLLLEGGELDQLEIISCSVLVRPEARHTDEDYGSFRSSPADFVPSTVRFLVVRVPDDIKSMVESLASAIGGAAA